MLIKDEELQAASRRAYQSFTEMTEKISSLEEHPGQEELKQILWSGISHLEGDGAVLYQRALTEIDELSRHRLMDDNQWLITLGGLLAIPAGAGAAGALVSGSMLAAAGAKSAEKLYDARKATENYLDFASRIERTQQDFDAAYARLTAEDSEA